MAQTQVDRVRIFGKKYVSAKKKLLTPSALSARLYGPRILMNSVPKAGTHLMERTLMLFPGIVFAGHRTLLDWDGTSKLVEKRVHNIHKGSFENAHLPAHGYLLDAVVQENLKVIFMIRDPRDVLVSHAKYVNEIDTTHPSHQVMAALADDSARLMAVIHGVEGYSAPVGLLWEKYEAWLHTSQTLTVKFEDLIGEKGGGSREKQLAVLRKLATHLEIKMSVSQMSAIADNVFSTNSPTFRKGVAGGWRKHLNEEHIEAIKQQTGDLLIRLGYEDSEAWS
jgi:hypothetical protein